MKTRKEQFDNLVLFEISDPDEHELHLENLIEDGKKLMLRFRICLIIC